MRRKRRKWKKALSMLLAGIMTFGMAVAALPGKNVEAATEEHDYIADRQDRLDQWYRDSRVGVMYHWSMATGGYNMQSQNYAGYPYVTTDAEGNKIVDMDAYNEELSDIDVSTWVAEAKKVGARYITFASFHSCHGYIRPWHSEIPGFPETERDFLQELIDEAKKEGIKVVVYMTTALDHALCDYYNFYDSDAYVQYAKDHHADWIKEKYGKELTEEEWDTTFNFERSTYGFGAFTFDEIEYLLKNYDIDGIWFDAFTNPTWSAEDEYTYAGVWPTQWGDSSGIWDGCAEKGYGSCTHPDIHTKEYQYDEEGFAKYYFYKRDICQMIHDIDPDCVTFVNNFPPYHDCDVVSQEGQHYNGAIDIIQEGDTDYQDKEALLIAGAWQYEGNENISFDGKKMIQQAVQVVTGGGVATFCTGPKITENGFADSVEAFDDTVNEFLGWSAEAWYDQSVSVGYDIPESYTSRHQEGGSYVMATKNEETDTHYLHVLTKPGDGKTVIMKDLMQPIENITDLHTGKELTYERKNGKLYISVEDWSDYDKYGDTIIKIQSAEINAESVAATLTELMDGGTLGITENYRVSMPDVPEGYDVEISYSSDANLVTLSGIVNQPAEEVQITLRMKVTDDSGKTAETDDMNLKISGYVITEEKINQSLISAAATTEYNSDNGAGNVLDGNTSTGWHSQVNVGIQAITLTMDQAYEISRISLLPRQDGVRNGDILDYTLSVSTDGSEYQEVKKGTLAEGGEEQNIILDTSVNAKYIKLTANRSSAENNLVYIAELNVWKKTDSVSESPAEIIKEKLQTLADAMAGVEKELYQYPDDEQQNVLSAVEKAKDVLAMEKASFEDMILAAEDLEKYDNMKRKDGSYRNLFDFENEQELVSFIDFTKNEGGEAGKGSLVCGEEALSGNGSMKVANSQGTAWSNGVVSSVPVADGEISGIVFRIKAKAGQKVKPMLHVNDPMDSNQNKDLGGTYKLLDLEGNDIAGQVTYDSTWGALKFEQDFDGYVFIPYDNSGFKNLDSVQAEDHVYIGFHFEHAPNYNPEYYVDDIGTYYGTDYAKILADLNAQNEAHSITVNGGTAEKTTAYAGESIEVSAAAENGKVFNDWTAEGIALSEEQCKEESITIIMPANDVVLTAAFSDETEKPGEGTDKPEAGADKPEAGTDKPGNEAGSSTDSTSATDKTPADSVSGTVQTGANTNVTGWAAVMILSAGICAVSLRIVKRRLRK